MNSKKPIEKKAQFSKDKSTYERFSINKTATPLTGLAEPKKKPKDRS